MFILRDSPFVQGKLKVQNNVCYLNTPSRSTSSHNTNTGMVSGIPTGGEDDYSKLTLEYEMIDTGRQQQTNRGKVKMRERYEFAEIHNDLSVTEATNYEVPKNLLTESYQNYSRLDHAVS